MNNQLIDVNNITSGMDLNNNFNSSLQQTTSINQTNLPPNIHPNFSQQPSGPSGPSGYSLYPSFNEHQIDLQNMANSQNMPLPDISQIQNPNNFVSDTKNFTLIKDLKWKDLDELSDISDDSDYSDNSDYVKTKSNYATQIFNFIILIILLIILFYVYKIYKEIMSYDEN